MDEGNESMTAGDTRPPSSSRTVHDVSCERCRKRKIKCDKREPCSRCVEAGTGCSFPSGGTRRRPASRQYVQTLEHRLQSLEAFIQRLGSATDASRRRLLSGYDPSLMQQDDQATSQRLPAQVSPAAGAGVSPPLTVDTSMMQSHGHVSDDAVSLRSREGRMKKLITRRATQFFGGTSLLQVQLPEVPLSSATRSSAGSGSAPTPQQFPTEQYAYANSQTSQVPFSYQPQDSICRQLMASFFTHCYQYNHFIYREYFLRDYATGEGPYYSDMLLYAICAVGAVISQDASQRMLSPVFAKRAEQMVFASLDLPDLTTLQTLMILGPLEIGQGRSSKGWLLCGMAFRLTHEMGLHLDPSNWDPTNPANGETSLEREILRRVYWAVFVSDKQLSLYFGRPPALYPREADVRNTIRIPYPPEWESLLDTYIARGMSATAFEDGIAVVGAFVHHVELAKIFHTMIVEVFEDRRRTDHEAATGAILQVHASLERWLSRLPHKLHWNQWTTGRVPHYVLHLHMLFHMGMIILHRPPSQSLSDHTVDHGENIEICYESLAALVRLIKTYRRHYRFESLPLDFVHILSAAAGVILLKRYLEHSPWTDSAISQPMDLILQVMESIEHVWPCIGEIKNGLLEASQPVPERQQHDFDLINSFEQGVQALPNPWFINPDLNLGEDAPVPDLGFLVTDDSLNDPTTWDEVS